MDAHRSQEETVPRTCAKCGAPLKPGQPDARCPRCALAFLVRRQPGEGDRDDRIDAAGLGLPEFKDYRCIELVAEGGMGQVFRAQQRSTRREVAVKVLHRSFLNSPRAVQRFTAEIDAIARLEHRHILPLYEAGEENGLRFFSMRLARGGSLADAIKALRWKPARDASEPERQRKVASFLANVAQAVQHAHARGVIHRDLKPGNILLDEAGEPLVADFGLAKASDSDIALTRTGEAFGTPAYMAPEQIDDSQRATTASDVYALGVILYELLAGTVPFHAASLPTLLEAIRVQDPAPISSSNPRINRDLETICLKCLNKEPARRYTSAGELEAELHRWLRGEPILARPADTMELARRWVRRHRTLASVLGVFVLTAAAGFLGVLRQWRETARVNSRLTVEISASQRKVAEQYFDAHHSYEAIPILTQQLRRHPKDAAAASRLWSAIAMRRWPVATRVLTVPDGAAGDMVWSPDGSLAATASVQTDSGPDAPYHLGILDLKTGAPTGRTHSLGVVPGRLEFSPDNQWVLTSFDQAYRLWKPNPPKPVEHPGLTNGPGSDFAWYPDSRGMLVLTGTNRAVGLRLPDAGGTASATPFETYATPGVASAVGLGTDGALVGVGDESGNVRLWNRGSGEELPAPRALDSAIAGVSFAPAGDPVLLMTIDRGCVLWSWKERRLVASLTNAQLGVFLPQTNRLLIQTRSAVQLVNSATGTIEASATAGTQLEATGTFSPDGRTVALSAGVGSGLRFLDSLSFRSVAEPLRTVWTFNAAHFSPVLHGGSPLFATTADQSDIEFWRLAEPLLRPVPAIAPGSLFLAIRGAPLVAAVRTNGIELHHATNWATPVRRFEHPRRIRSLLHAAGPNWLAAWDESQAMRIWSIDTGGEVSQFQLGTNAPLHVALSRDGRLLATISKDHELRQWDTRSGRELCPPVVLSPRREKRVGRANPFGLWFSPDSSRIAVSCYFDEIPVFRSGTTDRLYTIDDDANAMRIAFSNDGRWLATGGGFGNVRLWNASDGSPASTRLRQDGATVSIEFSPDDSRLLSSTLEGNARVWETSTGRLLGTTARKEQQTAIRSLFSPDGRRFVTNDGAEVRIWETETGLPLGEAVAVGRGQTQVHWSPDGSEVWIFGPGNSLSVLSTPAIPTPVPDWALRLADAMVGRTPNDRTGARNLLAALEAGRNDATSPVWPALAVHLSPPTSTNAPRRYP